MSTIPQSAAQVGVVTWQSMPCHDPHLHIGRGMIGTLSCTAGQWSISAIITPAAAGQDQAADTAPVSSCMQQQTKATHGYALLVAVGTEFWLDNPTHHPLPPKHTSIHRCRSWRQRCWWGIRRLLPPWRGFWAASPQATRTPRPQLSHVSFLQMGRSQRC